MMRYLSLFQATDSDNIPDVQYPITYTIVSGNSNGDWQIDSNTGEVTATRPADYESTPQGRG